MCCTPSTRGGDASGEVGRCFVMRREKFGCSHSVVQSMGESTENYGVLEDG